VQLGTNFGNTAPSTIVLVDVTNGTATALTDSIQNNQSPIWTPDGRAVYFVTNRNGPRDIYAIAVGSSGKPSGDPVRLTTGLNAMSIALSGDGQRLAYSVYSAKANVWSLPIPSGAPVSVAAATALTTGSQAVEAVNASRDGKWLYYDSNLHGASDLYRVATIGGEPERLTSDSVDKFQPAVSPDGAELVFQVARGNSRQAYTIPVSGGPMQPVFAAPTDQRTPAWSPDGNAIAYWDLATSTSWVIRRGTDRKWLAPRMVGQGMHPQWSPDGKTLAATSVTGRVAVVPSDSGPVRTIYEPRPGTTDPFAEWSLWSADGREIYFKSHDARGEAAIWSIPAAGGTPKPLVRFDDPTRPSTRAEFGSDAKRFYFTVNDRQSDVWVVELSHK
jgi:Tol biopolymer transport system component